MEPTRAHSIGLSVVREEAAKYRVSDEPCIRAVEYDVRGKLTACRAVSVPAYITEHACGAMLSAAFVANGAAIHGGEVEGLGTGIAERRVRVGGGAYGGTGGTGGLRGAGQEVGVCCGGGKARGARRNARVEGSGDGPIVGQEQVVEGVDVGTGCGERVG